VADKEYTFEAIDQHIRKADLSAAETAVKRVSAAAVAASPADVIGQICPIYRTIRPILVVLSNLPFIPESWRRWIKLFIEVMDKLCPQ
jgi:hypothetical protein